ncbi:MAG: ketoacyl-ACP synthase III [Gammaproteobacteria bacterium]|nr:MAG: ketoacyl-ACP synthase III [Gammaproteobacteria bacterium]
MTATIFRGARLAGITSAVPATEFDNVRDTLQFDATEVKKVVSLAGVKTRRVTTSNMFCSDLCLAAAKDLLEGLDWSADSIDVLIFITQTPDYFLPGSASLMHRDLALSHHCAVFDVGLGCSGYPYGIWLANMMIQTGAAKRILVLHGDTPSLFTDKEDRATYLLFGDGGTATAIETSTKESEWGFCLHSDGGGCKDLIIPGGGFRNPKPANERDSKLKMNGPNLFNFTVARVPEVIDEMLALMKCTVDDLDVFFFHQSNQFIMKHIAKKCGLDLAKVPLTLDRFGNIGGASVPLTVTQYLAENKLDRSVKVMLLGYGVGLSWGAAQIELDKNVFSFHRELGDLPRL